MRYTLPAVLLSLSALAAHVVAHDGHHDPPKKAADPPVHEGPSDVLDLTKDSFDTIVPGEDLIMVEFFAPWCGHCKALAPHYEEAATALKSNGIKIAKVDCTAEMEVCTKYKVEGYPTLKVFRNGTPSDYSGARKADGIISYMNKQSLPAVSVITSAEQHDEFSASDSVVVIHYTKDGDSKADQAFDKVANTLRDEFRFGKTSDASLAKAAGVSVPAVVLYKKFDEGKNILKDASKMTAETLTTFVKHNSFPIFAEIGPDNFATFADSGIPLAYLFVDPEDTGREDLIASLAPIANENRGKLHFVWIDGIKYVEHGKSLNLMKSTLPAFVVQIVKEQKKFPMDQSEKVSPKSVQKHVSAFLDGKIQPSVKSAPVPKTQDSDVYVLVADSFDEVVLDESKDVFVEFYAPWCGHCKKLAPIWDSLAEKYAKSHKNLIIAKQDMTENDLSSSAPFQVSGFPTLKFKKAGAAREWIAYEGDRSMESLVEFIESNVSESSASLDDSESQIVLDDDADIIRDEL